MRVTDFVRHVPIRCPDLTCPTSSINSPSTETSVTFAAKPITVNQKHSLCCSSPGSLSTLCDSLRCFLPLIEVRNDIFCGPIFFFSDSTSLCTLPFDYLLRCLYCVTRNLNPSNFRSSGILPHFLNLEIIVWNAITVYIQISSLTSNTSHFRFMNLCNQGSSFSFWQLEVSLEDLFNFQSVLEIFLSL